jgi:hypothetical protein
MVYLAIDYGCYEGWRLKEFSDAEAALAEVKSGTYSGCSGWKILEEIDAYAELKLKTDELREIKEYIRGFFIGIDQRISAIEKRGNE